MKDRVGDRGDLIFFAEYQQIIFDGKLTRNHLAWKGCVTLNTFLPIGIISQLLEVLLNETFWVIFIHCVGAYFLRIFSSMVLQRPNFPLRSTIECSQ